MLKEILELQNGNLDAGSLLAGIKRWPKQRNGFTPDTEVSLHSFLLERAESMRLGIDSASLKPTSGFIRKMLAQSSLPPIELQTFIDSLLLSQTSNGEIPLVFQEIACLNYKFSNATKEQFVVDLDDKTPRWERFTEENKSFVTALAQLGVRPLVIFGVSDILDFEEESTFALKPEALQRTVNQNRQHMANSISGLNDFFSNLDLPNLKQKPSLSVFFHSNLLEPDQNHRTEFNKNVEFLTQNSELVDDFRLWLISNFKQTHEYLTRLNPTDHLTQMVQMMALYATDNQRATDTARMLFPGENIKAVTSICLQPNHEPEWLTEKMACKLLDANISQIVPFPNAGKWWMNPTRIAQFTLEENNKSNKRLQQMGPEEAFRQQMEQRLRQLAPDLDTSDFDDTKRYVLKLAIARQRIKELFGEEIASATEQKYLERKKSK